MSSEFQGTLLCPGICVKRWPRWVHLTPFLFGPPLCLMVVLPHSRNRHMACRVLYIFIRASTAGCREQSIWQHPGYHPSSQLQGPSSSPVLGFRGKSLTSDIYADPERTQIGCKSYYSGRRWEETLFKILNLETPQWHSRRLGAHCCVPKRSRP